MSKDNEYTLLNKDNNFNNYFVDIVGITNRDDKDELFDIMFVRKDMRPAIFNDGEFLKMQTNTELVAACSLTMRKDTLKSLHLIISQMVESLEDEESK
ncbi:hypothetical protein JFB93_06225 [Providencia rettgeri]|uniref:hypothetical protein n=1 Tax=Providencia rettgeri TaxID=587 RepID=UPI0018E87C51|nr:hypothetical protein [Providencia rettgeri]QQE94426.1 hypothetical protein JFB93_06225 [Providencia rettgeri]QWJ92891.1 hypothetical protein KM147_06270 [Providencia rettgeri]